MIFWDMFIIKNKRIKNSILINNVNFMIFMIWVVDLYVKIIFNIINFG